VKTQKRIQRYGWQHDDFGQVGALDDESWAKQYPTTTHAKTVEFRISDEGNLNKLYGNIRKAWIKGRGNKFTIKSN
jgi:hypothetical protein